MLHAMLKKPLVESGCYLGNVLNYITVHNSEENKVGGGKENLKFWSSFMMLEIFIHDLLNSHKNFMRSVLFIRLQDKTNKCLV